MDNYISKVTFNRQALLLVGGGILMLLLVLIVPAVTHNEEAKGATEAKGVVSAVCDKPTVVNNILVNAGFTPDQFTLGEQFNLSLPAALESGNGRFTDKPPVTKEALIELLKSGKPAAQALLDSTVKMSGGTQEQALDPGNWEGFQLLTPSDWSGNTLFVDGKVQPAGTRHSAEGDIGWMFIHPEDCSTDANVVRVAIVRLGCGNPQLVPPSPPGKPTLTTVPSTTSTTVPPTTVPTSTTVPPTTTPTTMPPTTTPTCRSGKCVPPTTTPPPPTTAPSPPPPTQPNNGGQDEAGDGATNNTTPPATIAPSPASPTTLPPTTNPPPPAP